MPYKSDAQRRWAHTKAGTKALGGAAKVAHWDAESKGKRMPEHAKPLTVKQAVRVMQKRRGMK